MRADWWQIAEHLKDIQITTRMVTNGLGLTPETVDRMRSVGLATVAVSLDGLEATHDRIRAWPGLFRRVVAGMERVAAAGMRVSAITAVNPLNLGEAPAMRSASRVRRREQLAVQPFCPRAAATKTGPASVGRAVRAGRPLLPRDPRRDANGPA